MNSIFKRRSIRKYLDKEVEQEKVDLLLKAAMNAPSAGNQQPWEFYVIRDKNIIRQLSKCSPYASCLKNAPLAVIPVYRKEGLKFKEYAQIDMSICCENLWLEATELGLGCVWLGIAPVLERMSEVNRIIDIDDCLESFAIMAIGYPDEEKEDKDYYDINRIHVK
ncbi:MAG: nitroreductase family protein [Bacilli bacterium]|nr:nitroreductase family protein [Bacilli bacterium]